MKTVIKTFNKKLRRVRLIENFVCFSRNFDSAIYNAI